MLIYKLEEGTQFIDKIHEHIPYHHPVKNLTSMANHYGYYGQGEEGEENIERKHITILEYKIMKAL